MDRSAPIPSNEAKTHLAQLLDRVERGEELTISRHGRPVARLVPASPDHDLAAARRAVDALFHHRAKLGASGVADFDAAEIAALVRAGRKY